MTDSDSISRLFPGMQAFRSKLSSGEMIIGSAATFNDPLVSDALADSVDFLWYDLEHAKIDPAVLNAHLLAARGKKTASIVRVGDISAAGIKPVLDAGAEGIIAPQIQTLEEVEQFVSDCRYPPVGTRGLGPRVPTNFGRNGGPEYFKQANETIFVCVMIETVEAVENIDKIVRVPGLDSIVLGAGDLSGSLGKLLDFENPELHAALDRSIAVARDAGIYVGAGAGADPAFAKSMLARGIDWIQFGNDYEYMIAYLDASIADLRSNK